MELFVVGFIIFMLITLVFGIYIKVFIIDLKLRNVSSFILDDWDGFDIAVHYLNYVLHKYMKENSNISMSEEQIPAAVKEQWTSIWFQAKDRLINMEESYKRDLEALIINMKSKAIDIGLFKYDTSPIKSNVNTYLKL